MAGYLQAATLAAARSPERTHAEIEKYCDYKRRDPKSAMISGVGVCHRLSPEGRSKYYHRQQKEDSRHLKPKNSAHTAKRLEEPAQPLAQSPASAIRPLPWRAPDGASLRSR